MVDVRKEDEDKLMNHEYDGIRELDNDLPPWWINLFYVTIIFGVIYFLGYQIVGWVDNQKTEYKKEVIANTELMLKNENASVVANANPAEALKTDIADGQVVYKSNCVVCHGAGGEGTAMAPNLSDKYWIHGGDFESVQKTISDGVPAKGMLSWKPILGVKSVRQVARYVLSLQGTNPSNPKAPEGVLYDPIDTSKPVAVLTDSQSKENGLALYQQYCAACHGVDKNGGFASSLNDSTWKFGKGTIEDIMKITAEGNESVKMPAWKSVLSEKQIQEVSSYILNNKASK